MPWKFWKKIAMEFFLYATTNHFSSLDSATHFFGATWILNWRNGNFSQTVHRKKKTEKSKRIKKMFVWHRNDENRSCFSFSRLATMAHMTSDYVSLIEFPCGCCFFFLSSLYEMRKTISKIKLNCVTLEFLIRSNFVFISFKFNILN